MIVADEPVSALDVSVQAQVLNLMLDLQEKLGIAYLFISHDLGVVEHIGNRIAVMYLGRIVELAERDALFAHPTHPYTEALLQSAPVPDPHARRERPILEGNTQPAQSAGGVHVPSALPVCGGALPGGAPGATRDRGRAHGGVSPALTLGGDGRIAIAGLPPGCPLGRPRVVTL